MKISDLEKEEISTGDIIDKLDLSDEFIAEFKIWCEQPERLKNYPSIQSLNRITGHNALGSQLYYSGIQNSLFQGTYIPVPLIYGSEEQDKKEEDKKSWTTQIKTLLVRVFSVVSLKFLRLTSRKIN